MTQQTRIICQGFEKTESFIQLVETLLTSYDLEDSHLTFERRNRIYYGKISYQGKYVVSNKDIDLENLADKIITLLHTQIQNYETKKQFEQDKIIEEGSPSDNIQKIKRFVIKPTNLENALDHMTLLGHKFYLYVDIDSKPILLFKHGEEVFSQTQFDEYTLEEAIVELQDNHDGEYIAFQNVDTEELTVVYKRKTGDIGIIDASL